MALYEDLVRLPLAAKNHSDTLGRDSRLLRDLAQMLREAALGEVSIVHCAWCGCYRVGEEWLHLDAIGHGQQRIAATLRDRTTHSICPDCFEIERLRAEKRQADPLLR